MKRCLFVIAGMAMLSSCKKEVDLNLGKAGPHIVIQGAVTDAAGPYTIGVNMSVDFKAANSFPPVSGGRIKISSSENETDSLIETSPGVYTTRTLQGKPGVTYTLSVRIGDSAYTAVSTMPYPVTFDSITFRNNAVFGDQHITAVPNFQDPGGVKNYYLFNEYQNGVQLTKDIFVFSDRLSDGRYITRGLRNADATLNTGDEVVIEMFCIDEPVFNYFNQLDESGGSGGAFNTAASPANPVSNIDNGALGYFSAHTTRSKKTTVHIY